MKTLNALEIPEVFEKVLLTGSSKSKKTSIINNVLREVYQRGKALELPETIMLKLCCIELQDRVNKLESKIVGSV